MVAVTTHYGIRRHDDGYWWCGFNRWSLSAATARWFASLNDAEVCALRELPDPRTAWEPCAIPKQAYC